MKCEKCGALLEHNAGQERMVNLIQRPFGRRIVVPKTMILCQKCARRYDRVYWFYAICFAAFLGVVVLLALIFRAVD